MDEKSTIHDLEMQAKNTRLLINRLTKAYTGKEIQELLHAEPRNPYTFEDYCSALKRGMPDTGTWYLPGHVRIKISHLFNYRN